MVLAVELGGAPLLAHGHLSRGILDRKPDSTYHRWDARSAVRAREPANETRAHHFVRRACRHNTPTCARLLSGEAPTPDPRPIPPREEGHPPSPLPFPDKQHIRGGQWTRPQPCQKRGVFMADIGDLKAIFEQSVGAFNARHLDALMALCHDEVISFSTFRAVPAVVETRCGDSCGRGRLCAAQAVGLTIRRG
jgi:hypothetical protein